MKLKQFLAPALALGAALLVAGCTSAEGTKTTADEAVVAATTPGGPEDFDALLQKHVKGEWVDYAGWKANAADMARFDRFLAWQGDADVNAMSKAEKIAFYINAYNAVCIKLILDAYPVHSPLDIDGFFDKEKHKFKVGGEMLSNPAIEYDRLVPLGDQRMHFAVVCADRGCAPLWNQAYKGSTLDQDLEAAANRFVIDKRNLICDPAKKEIQVSKIFEWYPKDFVSDPDRPASKPEQYLANWASGDCKSVLASGGYTVKIIEWNWTLNEKR